MMIPYNSFLIKSNNLTCDESSMTGEVGGRLKDPLPTCIAKRDDIIKAGNKGTAGVNALPSPIVLFGSRVIEGEGVLIVIGVVAQNNLVRVSQEEETGEVVTPLQMKLANLKRKVGILGIFAFSVTVLVLFIRFFVEKSQDEKWNWESLLNLLMIEVLNLV